MDIESIRNYCISKKAVTECMPFDDKTLVFKVADKIFALAALAAYPLRLNLKCDPEKAIDLREQFESVRPGYHSNKKHWNTIEVNGEIPKEALNDLFLNEFLRWFLVNQKVFFHNLGTKCIPFWKYVYAWPEEYQMLFASSFAHFHNL